MNNNLNFKINHLSLFKFALPTMLANVFMSIYSTVDGIFVSNYVGTDALSAVNIFMPFVMIVLALGTMIGTGGSAVVAAQLGEGKERQAKENFSMLCVVCTAFCIIASALSFVFRKPLLYLLGANDVIFDYCLDYAMPLLFVAPVALLGMALQTFFIAAGKPGLGMSFSVAGGALNIFLDWLLVGKLGMECTGAAFATGLGYSVPGILGILYFISARKGTLYFVKPKWHGNVLLKTVINGSSEMVAMVATGITSVMMNNIIMDIEGEDGVAAISILIYAMTLLTSVYMGYVLCVAPVTSYNHGADNRENLKKSHRINLSFIAIMSVVMYALGFVLRDSIISVFADEGTRVYEMAQNGYMIFSISFLYMGFNMYGSSFFTALGDGKTSAIISFCRGLIFLSAALYALSYFFGLNGLFAAMPSAEAFGIALTIFYLKKLKGKYGYA